EVREANLMRADRDGEGRLLVFQLARHVVNVADGIRLSLGQRAPYALRINVAAQTQKHRRAQIAVFGPVLEFHFGDGGRLHPGRRVVELRLFGERTGARFQRLQSRLHLREAPRVEARSDVRGVAQLARVPVADQQRAEPLARTL